MQGWGIIILIVSLYVLLFHSEKDDRVPHEEPPESSLKGMFKIVKGLLFQINILKLILFFVSFKCLTMFSGLSSVYLLDEMKYDQMRYSFLT
jgi:hypothetical protein